MEMWKPLRASHISTPQTAAGVSTIPLRCTNYLLGAFHRARQHQNPSKYRLPVWGGDFGLDGLVKDAIETLDEGGWVFELDAFEEERLVEE
jgi:hypothetical protein